MGTGLSLHDRAMWTKVGADVSLLLPKQMEREGKRQIGISLDLRLNGRY